MKDKISIYLILIIALFGLAAVPPPPFLETFELKGFSYTTRDIKPYSIKLKILLGYAANPQLKKELQARRSQIRHLVNLVLQGKKYAHVNTVSGKLKLAQDIKTYINKVLMQGKVEEVYFQEFVIN